jgi:hypothetical protein
MSGFYEPEDEPQSGGSSGKGLLIVLGVVACLGLVCAGVVVAGFVAVILMGRSASGTFTYVGTKVGATGSSTPGRVDDGIDRSTSDRVVTQFLDHLRFQRIDAAYNLTSQRFQQRVTRPAFDNLVLGIPAFSKLDGTEIRSMKVTGEGRVTYAVTPHGARTVELQLVNQDGAWDLDDIVP